MGKLRGVALAALCLGFLACSTTVDGDVANEASASVAALTATCAPVDDEDTTCDGIDDDCDGVLDEDCDFGPSACPAGTHVIAGSAGCDWLWGTSGRDCILGYGGNDVLFGLEGDDVLVGGPGNDVLAGWGGNDQLFGDRGDDTLLGDGGDDLLDGGDGNDSLFGGDGNDVANGGMCQDLLLASRGHDVLHGDEGVDRIEGSAPHSIDGGGGKDACTGTSCELSGNAARLCLRDADCPSNKHCVRRSQLCVSASDAPIRDESCDGFDDDCDGRYDEDYVAVTTHCGSGQCGGTGVTSCVDGAVHDSCSTSGGGGASSDASCDGLDDDCDGSIDEEYVSLPTTCGVGACAATGATSCVAGSVVNSCAPGTPASADASCNAFDDDCDGSIDENYAPQATACGVGACAASGVTSCIAGIVLDSCAPGAPAGDDASCNAIDDDCNGAVDEDYAPLATTCGVGACAATGATSCVAGSVVNSCAPGTPASADASCNAIDDDCDGNADEDYVATPTQCQVQGCSAVGVLQCVSGSLNDTCPTAPTCVAELACDDLADNDGDSLVDCQDPDCAQVPHCLVQHFSATVPGSANLWGAGHAAGPGGGSLPPGIVLQLGAGSVVTFTSVTGTVIQAGALALPADGAAGAQNLPSNGGIAGYSHATRMRALGAVFLGPSEPVNPAPAQLSFANGEFTTLAPGLRQMFFIGDGHTASATVQQFTVPAGATRLFIGLTDLCSGNVPGCFTDNSGSYALQGDVHF